MIAGRFARLFSMQRRSFPGFLRMPPPVFFPKNAKILLICQRFTDKTVHLCCRPPRGGRGLKFQFHFITVSTNESPPSRGAWIEITMWSTSRSGLLTSPPSRGAWIEIRLTGQGLTKLRRRPPRGGRGLKYVNSPYVSIGITVAPLAGGVD